MGLRKNSSCSNKNFEQTVQDNKLVLPDDEHGAKHLCTCLCKALSNNVLDEWSDIATV